ncbi:MAG TPA: flavodoxin domain-containing protein [Gaiella sp.]
MARATRVAVIYYSATGNVHKLAHALAEGAEAEGAEVRLRHVEELASELLISQNQYWAGTARRSRTNRSRRWATSSGPTASRSERPPASATSPGS